MENTDQGQTCPYPSPPNFPPRHSMAFSSTSPEPKRALCTKFLPFNAFLYLSGSEGPLEERFLQDYIILMSQLPLLLRY